VRRHEAIAAVQDAGYARHLMRTASLLLARIGIGAALALSAVPTALSCTARLQPPPKRIAAGYQEGYGAVVVLTVTDVDVIEEPWLTNGWQAVGKPERVVSGSTDVSTFEFGRYGGTCNDSIQPPKPGERWIVYLRNATEQRKAEDFAERLRDQHLSELSEHMVFPGVSSRVALSYPLDIAREADPLLPR
jgi:hypothetical protein